uniref:Uncharacterized protein n=1 Tax=Alexandrium catenella TaxID=2925 RepID=A0A7S1RZB8_ALECA
MSSVAKVFLSAALILLPAQAGKALMRHGGEVAGSLVRPIEFKHTLRVCNAFPSSSPIDVFRSQEKLTNAGPMAYKECRDFEPKLVEGDRLTFKVGDSSAGTFAVGALPANDAVLLLAVHRHDEMSTAVSFESHTFAAGLESPQIAVIDAYKGSAQAVARIADAASKGEHLERARDEELRFDNAVAVSPGAYEVFLSGNDGAKKANSSLIALKHESYVIMRIGVEAKTQGQQSYPQDIVVYPRSPAEALGGARMASPLLFLPLVVAAALFGCGLLEM